MATLCIGKGRARSQARPLWGHKAFGRISGHVRMRARGQDTSKHAPLSVKDAETLQHTFAGGRRASHLGNGIADLVTDRLIGFLGEAGQEMGLHGIAGIFLCDLPQCNLICFRVLRVGNSFESHTAREDRSKRAKLMWSERIKKRSCI